LQFLKKERKFSCHAFIKAHFKKKTYSHILGLWSSTEKDDDSTLIKIAVLHPTIPYNVSPLAIPWM
jgi:hypothetical protein